MPGRRNLNFTDADLSYIRSKVAKGSKNPFMKKTIKKSRYVGYDWTIPKCTAPDHYHLIDDPKALNLLRGEFYREGDIPFYQIPEWIPSEEILDTFAGRWISYLKDKEEHKETYEKALYFTNEQWMELLEKHRERLRVKRESLKNAFV